MAVNTDKSERQLQEMVESYDIEPLEDVEVDIFAEDEGAASEDDGSVIELADGSAIVELDEDDYEASPFPEEHTANLAEHVGDQEMVSVALDLMRDIEDDLMSRKEWEYTLIESLKTLGLKIEEKNTPWQGACSVVHPLLAEAIVRFQSDTIGDILPPGGPVKANIVGISTPEKEDQARRVAAHMNYVLMNEMDEYRPETEKLLFGLALKGAAFRKLFPNPITGKPKSVYIEADDLIVNVDATDMLTADRITHRIKYSRHQIDRLIRSGFYRDVTLQDPFLTESDVERAVADLVGMKDITTEDRYRTVYETQCFWDFGEDADGVARPYIVTVDKTNQTVLAIYRNWKEDDPDYEREEHIVHYEFIPGLGFYGFGYAHLIGNTAKAVTSILQQLVDAGTLSNVPGGLKSRNARMTDDSGAILPGEWRDVDVTSGKLTDHFMPTPTKEPSQTLFNLMVSMVEDGRRLASMADLNLKDMQNSQAPVGTTLAILERSLKMQTAIQQRIHAGMKKELKILARIIAASNPEYPYDVEEGKEIAAEDYDDRVDVIPVADPNASSLAQRVMQYQAALTASQQSPNVYDTQYLNRQFVEAIGMQNADKVVPMDEDIEGMDPISENATIMNLGKVSAEEYQDHPAHIRVHMALQQDPDIQQMIQNSPAGNQISSATDAHIREHMAFQMKREIELEIGVPLPELGKKMPDDVEQRIATLAADATDQLTGKKQAMAKAEKDAAQQEDPIIQMKQEELQLQKGELQRKIQKDQMDHQRKMLEIQINSQMEQAKLTVDVQQAIADNDLDKAKMILQEMDALAERSQKELLAGAEMGVRVAEMVSSRGVED